MNARQQSGFLEDFIMTDSRSSGARSEQVRSQLLFFTAETGAVVRSEHDRLQISCYKAGTGLFDEHKNPAKKDSQSSANIKLVREFC